MTMPTPNTYAYGQVLILPFQETFASLRSFSDLLDLQTVVIIKTHRSKPKFKICGGMVEENETFPIAAARELSEETGILCDHRNLRELYRTKKPRGGRQVGSFDQVLFAGFGCDFSTRKNPHLGEIGDEKEKSLVVRFGDLLIDGKSWKIPTQSHRRVSLFPRDALWLQRIAAKQTT